MIAKKFRNPRSFGERDPSLAEWIWRFLWLACSVWVGALPTIGLHAQEASPARTEASRLRAEAERRDAAELLPPSVVAYVEVSSPARLVEFLLEHPLRDRVEAMPAIAEALNSDGMTQFRSAVSVFEAGMGMRWPKVVASLTQGGAYAAFDAEHQAAIALLQAEDEAVLAQFRDTIFSAVRAGTSAGSSGDPIQSSEYRGVTGYSLGENAVLAVYDRWLIVSNKPAAVKSVIDQLLDPAMPSLADSDRFRQSKAEADSDARAWGMVQVAAIRDAGVAKQLYSGKTENLLVELLFGGIASTLKQTPWVAAELLTTNEAIDLRISSPLDTAWAGEERAYYFGQDSLARAPELLEVRERVFALSLHRDLSEMWLRAGDLMTDKANDQLAQADTQLTTFFSGKDFGEDILGSFGPEVQFLVARQAFDAFPRPAIRLPAFALKMHMNAPEKTKPEMRRVFQSFIGFLNITGAMQGQPQFDLGMEQSEARQLVTASYVVNDDLQDASDAPINFNFSPTLAFAGSTFVLASTTDLAREMIELPTLEKVDWSEYNSIARLEATAVGSSLRDNLEQLIAQNMLEKGHSRRMAEAEIGTLLELIELFEGADLALGTSQGMLDVRLALQLISPLAGKKIVAEGKTESVTAGRQDANHD